MGQATEQIAGDIDEARQDLEYNLRELEARLKSMVDWRDQFRRHPASMIVAALLGGVLLSSLLGRRG